MSKRDAISIAAWKVFDSLPNEEKKEVFLDEIERIEADEDFKKIKKYWDILDENKKLCAERKGFKIYYIWENDYVNNSNKIIEDCLSFLKMEDWIEVCKSNWCKIRYNEI